MRAIVRIPLILALMVSGAAHAMSPPCTALFEAREQTRLARIALDDAPRDVDRMMAWLEALEAEKFVLELTHADVTDSPTRELLDGLRDEYRFHQSLGKTTVAWRKQLGARAARERVTQTIIEIGLRQYEAWVTVAEVACTHPPEKP